MSKDPVDDVVTVLMENASQVFNSFMDSPSGRLLRNTLTPNQMEAVKALSAFSYSEGILSRAAREARDEP